MPGEVQTNQKASGDHARRRSGDVSLGNAIGNQMSGGGGGLPGEREAGNEVVN